MEIAIKNVKKVTKSHSDINGISLSIKSNEILGIIGADGAGKTTLMRLLTTFYSPDDGDILYNGVSIYKDTGLYKSHIGYMARTNPLPENMSVIYFLEYIAKISGTPKYLIPTRIIDILRECRLETEKNSIIKFLSKGAKRRLGIAQAIIHNPSLLLLDHPTAELDPRQADNLRDIIKKQSLTRTTILCSQDATDLSEICTRIIFLNKGKITLDTTSEELDKLRTNNQIYRIDIAPIQYTEYINELANIECIERIERHKNNTYIYTNNESNVEKEIFQLCTEKGWYIKCLTKLELTYEDILKQHLYNNI